MAKPKLHRFERQDSHSPAFKLVPRPSSKPQPTPEEDLPVGPEPLAEKERKTLVLKLIDFLETS